MDDEETLSPADLRGYLDTAGIKWRVLLVSGCFSGVFVAALKDPYTMIATASAADAPSYGCANANAFTDLGRAVLEDGLARGASFTAAFSNAGAQMAAHAAEAHAKTSKPALFVGDRIEHKLSELEKPHAAN